jgi:hypothetical protein
MQRSVTLRGRTQVAALLHSVEQEADHGPARVAVDARNRRRWRQLVLGVLVARSTRLVEVARVVAPQRRAQSVKAVAQGLAYFLRDAKVALPAWSQRQVAAALRQLDPAHLVTYEGKVLVGLDPTEYAKRSRGRGKAGRQMQYSGRVRRSTTAAKTKRPRPQKGTHSPLPGAARAAATPTPAVVPVATTYGYVDIWAGVALQDKQFLPLARALFSSAQPTLTSQNRVEEAVLAQALRLVQETGRAAIVLGDRGIGRKELIIRLAQQKQDFVLRLDPDVLLVVGDEPGRPLSERSARGATLAGRGHLGPRPGGQTALPPAHRAGHSALQPLRAGR